MAKKFTSINGITIHVCRKLVKYAFGEANAFAVRYNYHEIRYDIWISDTQDMRPRAKYFEEYWGIGFHIIYIRVDDTHTIPSTHANPKTLI